MRDDAKHRVAYWVGRILSLLIWLGIVTSLAVWVYFKSGIWR